MSEFVTRVEYEEHNLRMEDEHKRQNHRIEVCEKALEQNNKLLVTVEKLALSLQNMQKEQSKIREDIDEIKNRDGEKWRETGKDVIKIILGILIGYILKQMGIF